MLSNIKGESLLCFLLIIVVCLVQVLQLRGVPSTPKPSNTASATRSSTGLHTPSGLSIRPRPVAAVGVQNPLTAKKYTGDSLTKSNQRLLDLSQNLRISSYIRRNISTILPELPPLPKYSSMPLLPTPNAKQNSLSSLDLPVMQPVATRSIEDITITQLSKGKVGIGNRDQRKRSGNARNAHRQHKNSRDVGINKAKTQGLGITILKPNEKTAGRAYDFGCSASQKHKCACQLKCEGNCDNALDLCSSLPGCKFISLSVGNEWATLKRGPTDEEMRLLHIDGRDMSWEDLKRSQQSIRAEAALEPPLDNMHPFADVVGALLPSLKASSYSPLCGKALDNTKTELDRILQNKLGIIALSYRTPSTLQNAMQSWRRSGLLQLTAEKIAILNDPLPIDVAIAQRHGFQVFEPNKMPGVRMAKKNVITIGTAFFHGLAMSKSDYVLFLEKDFKIDTTLAFEEIKKELLAAIWLLEKGIPIVRLRSRKEQGCGTFRECQNGANKPNWVGETTMKRRRNWWSFYCDRTEIEPNIRKVGANLDDRMADCLDSPNFRCFTSWDSNWSLNAVIVRRDAMLRQTFKFRNGKPFGTIANYGRNMWEQQEAFEVGLLHDDWGELQVPLCISYNGIFVHEEIDGGYFAKWFDCTRRLLIFPLFVLRSG